MKKKQRQMIGMLLALVVLWGVVVVLFRCQLRKWVARWMCGGSIPGHPTV